jgi:ATP-binding cassette subfamily B protein
MDKAIDKTITMDVYKKLITLPNYYFNSRQTGDIMNRINELEYIKELIVRIPIIMFTNIFLILLSGIILFYINSNLFYIFLIVVLIYCLIAILFNNKNKKSIREIQENNSIVNSYIKESISGISTIKNLNIKNFINNTFNNKYNDLINSKYSYGSIYNIESILKNLTMFIGLNTILYIGFIYVNNNVISLSNLILFNLIIVYFLEPLKDTFDLESSIKNGISSIRRLSDMYNIKESNGDYIHNDIYNIRINNLSFSYNGVDKILDSFTSIVSKGDGIVVLGNSGSGKSTLFKIITKQYEVNDNAIFINNIDINKWETDKLRENICYISQNENLFTDTLLNNITLGMNISNDVIMKFCRLTYVDEIMREKNIDFNSLIEEEGMNFSAGEKQRIILLRCLIRNNKVLILDESLNGVDLHLERKILENLLELYKDKILIYITHRKDNINLFNKTINFNKERSKNGKIKSNRIKKH